MILHTSQIPTTVISIYIIIRHITLINDLLIMTKIDSCEISKLKNRNTCIVIDVNGCH